MGSETYANTSTDDDSISTFITAVANLAAQCDHDNTSMSQLLETNQTMQTNFSAIMKELESIRHHMNYTNVHATTVQDRKGPPSSIHEVPHIQQTTPPDTPYSIKSRTSTLIFEHHLDAKSLYMNIQKPAHHGAQGELMHGTQDSQKISINVTACTS